MFNERFEQPPMPEPEKPAEKTPAEKAKDYEAWKEHFGIAAEIEEQKELAEKKEQEGKEWRETFYKKGGTRGKERIEKAVSGVGKEAEIPKKEVSAEAKEVKEAQAAEEKREKTHEDISRRLLEHPSEALYLLRKGMGLKLDRACIDFTTGAEKLGAKALKGLIWPAEKVLGRPLGEAKRAGWTALEFLGVKPGINRLDKTLKIHDQIERLQKGEMTPEQAEQLKKLPELHKDAARGQWEEIENFNNWHEKKKDTLEACRTFGHTRENLEIWAFIKEKEAAKKKEKATGKRIKEVGLHAAKRSLKKE